MHRTLLAVGALIVVGLLSATPLGACGDKLLTLGRGIRFQSLHTPRPASVLLYLSGDSQAVSALADSKLETALREAGHEVRSAVSRRELEDALKSGQHDVVLAHFAAAPQVEQAIQSAGAPAVLLPLVDEKQKTEADSAKKQYRLVLKMPDRAGRYCHLVDQAMELRLKGEQAKRTQ